MEGVSMNINQEEVELKKKRLKYREELNKLYENEGAFFKEEFNKFKNEEFLNFQGSEKSKEINLILEKSISVDSKTLNFLNALARGTYIEKGISMKEFDSLEIPMESIYKLTKYYFEKINEGSHWEHNGLSRFDWGSVVELDKEYFPSKVEDIDKIFPKIEVELGVKIIKKEFEVPAGWTESRYYLVSDEKIPTEREYDEMRKDGSLILRKREKIINNMTEEEKKGAVKALKIIQEMNMFGGGFRLVYDSNLDNFLSEIEIENLKK